MVSPLPAATSLWGFQQDRITGGFMATIQEVMEFDLHLSKKGTKYQAKAEIRFANRTSQTDDSPMRFDDLKLLGKLSLINVLDGPEPTNPPSFVKDLLQLINQIDPPDPAMLERLGDYLYQALPLSVRDLYNQAWGWVRWSNALQQRRLLRVRLHVYADELGKLPWEYMYVKDEKSFLCQDSRRSLVRYPHDTEPSPDYPINPGGAKVLVWIAAPPQMPQVKYEEELAVIQEVMKQRGDDSTVEVFRYGDFMALTKKLQGDYNVLHYIGHAGFDEGKGGKLLLERAATGPVEPVYAYQLKTLMRNNPQYRLVFLNACQTGMSDTRNMYNSLAVVLTPYVPVVVAMQYAIPPDSASTFSHQFYSAFAQGTLLDQCVTDGRDLLNSLPEQNMDWGIPAIYSRAELAIGILSIAGPPAAAPPGAAAPAPGP
jgi:hypothetical protein